MLYKLYKGDNNEDFVNKIDKNYSDKAISNT